ncbi:MAG: hypothetical protein QM759_06765 [Terricaulis sp.]
MRILIVTAAAAAVFAFGAASASAQHSAPSPFPVQRGTAPPPPQPGASTHAAPPQGVGPGGIDFGQWRSAETETYATSFKTQLAAREGGKDASAIQADLQANGFACEQGARLDCRIEIADAQCEQNWYVVVDDQGVHPGYEKACRS